MTRDTKPSQGAYRGRFAPSPTGRLHLGSLLAAAGSYLQARANRGEWLLRIEDLDAPRVVPGATAEIQRTLEQLGFEWDGPVVQQSDRTGLYGAALTRLDAAGSVFLCSCSRQELAALGNPPEDAEPDELYYPGLCRTGPRNPAGPHAARLRVPARRVSFQDALQGAIEQDVSRAIGDFVIRRRDGLYSYQLAVVVDDAAQGITEVVRGCDLLGNTPRQILLHEALGLKVPAYAHLPLLVEPGGAKLAKSRRSLPVDVKAPGQVLHNVFQLLQLSPPADVVHATSREAWAWAVPRWNPSVLSGIRQVELRS